MIFIKMRKYMKTIMWCVAIIIVPAFVLWNVGSAIRNRKSGYAGELYGKKIVWDTYFQAKQSARNSAWLKHGDKLDQFVNLEEQAWTRLILLSEAKKRNITVTKDELLRFIKNLPIFQFTTITPQSYATIVARLFQQTPADFEKSINNSLIMDKLIAEVTSQIEVTDAEIKKLYLSENEQASASYVIVETNNFLDKVSTDDETALKNYYENNKPNFKTQPKVLADYIEIKLEPLKKNILIDEERIEKYYDSNKEKYLITNTESTTEENTEEKKIAYKPLSEVSESIKEKLIENEMNNKASALARKVMNKLYTDIGLAAAAQDNGLTAQKTGPFSMTEEIPNIGLNFHFLKAAFSLQVGDISEVIITPTAYYILMPTKKIEPYIAEYTEVTDKVKQEYKKSKAAELAQEEATVILGKIQQIVKDKQIGFEEAAKNLELTVKKVEKFTRSGYISELGFAENFTKAAFSLEPGKISDAVSVPRGFCILTTEAIDSFNEADFNTKKDQYREKVLVQKKNNFLIKWFEKLKTEANPKSYLDENNRP